MSAKRPPCDVSDEREAKHQQANSGVRGVRPPLRENWPHADFPRSILAPPQSRCSSDHRSATTFVQNSGRESGIIRRREIKYRILRSLSNLTP